MSYLDDIIGLSSPVQTHNAFMSCLKNWGYQLIQRKWNPQHHKLCVWVLEVNAKTGTLCIPKPILKKFIIFAKKFTIGSLLPVISYKSYWEDFYILVGV